MHRYEEQIERAKRWYGRFKRINDGSTDKRSVDDCMDDIQAFFMACYHVKDHLQKDKSFSKHSDDEVEKYVTATRALAICADICNGIKHLQLDRKPRSGDVPKVGGRVFEEKIGHSLSGPDPEPVSAMKLIIEHKGATLDAFTIATEALDAWEKFVV